MTVDLVDLAAFLLARLDEDERVARAAPPGPWRWDATEGAFAYEPDPSSMPRWGHQGPDLLDVEGRQIITSSGYDTDNVVVGRPAAVHIARHDPARVLAEVEAKRSIVELHQGEHECSTFDPNGEIDNCTWVIGICSTLLVLALPYRSHPDYDAAWEGPQP